MKRYQKILISVIAFLALLLVAGLFLNSFVEKKAVSLLEEQLPQLKFDKLKVQVFKNEAEMSKINLKNGYVNIQSERLKVSGLNYWKFLTNKDIHLNSIEVNDPEVIYQENRNSKNKGRSSSGSSSEVGRLKKTIQVEEIQLNNAEFSLLDSLSEEKIKVKNFNFLLKNLSIDSSSVKHKIPFEFGDFALSADSISLKVGKLHDLKVTKIEVQNKKASLNHLKLASKFSKTEFQNHTPIEKDRYDLTVDNIVIRNQDFGFRNDSVKFQTSNLLINNANFEIYRDKMQPDDTSIKPMYSDMLRNMPFLLNIDTLDVKNTRIVYEERMKADRDPGKVVFSNLDGEITNLTNFTTNDKFPETRIKASASFMDEAPLSINWSFRVDNRSDWFAIDGNMGTLSAQSINGFLRPSMNVIAEGSIESMSFDFSGNRNKATGGLNIAYEDFKIEVLKKDGTEKSGFLTTIANIFVKNNGESGENINNDLEIERDKTKSFWNYLWSCIKKGALKTFT